MPVTQDRCFKVDLAINVSIISTTFRILPVTQLLLNTGEQQQGAIRAKRQELMKICLLPWTEEFVGNEHFSAFKELGWGCKIPTQNPVGIVRSVCDSRFTFPDNCG